MSGALRSTVKALLRPVASALTAGQPKILMYHRFNAGSDELATDIDLFREQAALLKKQFRVRTMSDVARQASIGSVESNVAVITVDDGYEDFYLHAWPVLRELDLPATVFVTTGFIAGELHLWPDTLRAILHAAAPGEYVLGGYWEGRTIHWRGPEDIGSVWSDLADRLLPELPQTRIAALEDLATSVGIRMDDIDMSPYAPMSWAQLTELSDAVIEIGDHTWSHCNLAVMGRDEILEDVGKSIEALQTNAGIRASGFAYPNGTIDDYSAVAAKTIEEIGFDYAVLAHPRRFERTQRYAIGRLDGSGALPAFRNSVSGFELLRNSAPLQGQA